MGSETILSALAAYIPMDRRQAMAHDQILPERSRGAALFADISGFTPLTEALARELGPQRGAEELTIQLNRVYDALIDTLHLYGGSVIGFSGDAITCWLDDDTGLRAAACGLAMQAAMQIFTYIPMPSGSTISLAMKASIAAGEVRRFVVGDPDIQRFDVLSGATLDVLAAGEHQAGKGEVLIDGRTAVALDGQIRIKTWREDEDKAHRFAVLDGLAVEVSPQPWPPLPVLGLEEDDLRPWLLKPVYQRLRQGQGDYLAELRPAVALFLRFGGIDYDRDPDAGEKLDRFIRQLQRIIAGYDGSLIQLTIGDKGSYLYVAFGAPTAHENDALRAAAAALEMRAAAARIDWTGLVQIGIAKGRMRAGAYGSSSGRTYGVLGEYTNLAARLMQAAQPGHILAARSVFQDSQNAMVWERLPDITVKGRTDPVIVYRLAGAKNRPSLHLQENVYRLPMVGRAAELRLVEQKLAQVLSGRGQIVAITGEAGMGKSRLTGEIVRLCYAARLEGYGGESQSYGANAGYLTWHSIWRGFFGLQPDWTLEESLIGLEGQIALIDPALKERIPLLAPVLNLPIPENELTRSLDAKIRKSSLEALLADCVRVRGAETPLLFVLEDLHWMDPLSHDLLEVLGRAVEHSRVMIVLVYRPLEIDRLQTPRLSVLPYFTEIVLSEFSPDEAAHLAGLKLRQLFGETTTPPPELLRRLIERSQGNPFYIEELLNYLQDSNIRLDNAQALAALDLPTSLQSLILTRIDQLSDSQKLTIRLAAVIGRLFRAAVLWGAYTQLGDEQQIRADLEYLSKVELTVVDNEPEMTYFFRHIITQEVAYDSLPFATRGILHEQIARFLEQNAPTPTPQQIDLLAFHYGLSDNLEKKRVYLLKAGEAAQAAYSNAAALEYYTRVIPLLPDEQQPAIRLKLGQVLELTGSWKEAVREYRHAMDTAAQNGDRRLLGRGQAATGELLRKQGQYEDAGQWLRSSRQTFESISDRYGIAQSLQYTGSLAAQQGDYPAASELYEQSLALWREIGEKAREASVLSNLGIVARLLGDYERAQQLHEAGLSLRRELGDRWAIAISLNNLGNVEMDQGRYTQARARLEEAVRLQREVGDKYYIANALNNLGNITRVQGDYDTSYRLYRESLQLNQELGDRWALAYLLEDIGCLVCLQGRFRQGLRLVAAASVVRETIRAPLSTVEQEKLNRLLSAPRQALSEELWLTWWAEGRAMALPDAIHAALAADDDLADPLSGSASTFGYGGD